MDTIIQAFTDLPTTAVSDTMKGLNNLDPSIKPLDDSYKLVGRAYTVRIPIGDNLAVLQAIKEAKPGDVLVVDAKGDEHRAIAGDFVLGMAQTRGIAGVVVDGAVRDIEDIKALDFPVFCKGTTVAAGGKEGQGEVDIPISCGGVSVNPGDLIIGDVDGVVVVPQSKEQEVLEKAKAKINKDAERDQKVSGNPDEIIKYIDGMLAKRK